jgi:predicted DNA-binding transcriptional regulator YafY
MMRRADRLFDIVQSLRAAARPMTAAALADHLEVTVRTIYRDIAALQASRVPIEGAAGLGYVLRRGFDLPPLTGVDLAEIRESMRSRRKIAIAYVDADGRGSTRTIWPIALAYYVDVTVIAGWCELRDAFRHFRADRIRSARVLEERFPADGGRLFAEWLALGKDRPDAPH